MFVLVNKGWHTLPMRRIYDVNGKFRWFVGQPAQLISRCATEFYMRAQGHPRSFRLSDAICYFAIIHCWTGQRGCGALFLKQQAHSLEIYKVYNNARVPDHARRKRNNEMKAAQIESCSTLQHWSCAIPYRVGYFSFLSRKPLAYLEHLFLRKFQRYLINKYNKGVSASSKI